MRLRMSTFSAGIERGGIELANPRDRSLRRLHLTLRCIVVTSHSSPPPSPSLQVSGCRALH